MFRNLSGVMLIVVMTALAAAAQQSANPPANDSLPTLTSFGTGDLWSSVGRLGLTLVAVLGLIWITMWLARRVLKGRIAGRGESGLRVRERLFLAPKKSIEIVSVGGRMLVLGVTENQISMLTELAPGDLPDPANAVQGRPVMPRAQEQRQRDLLRQARTKMLDLFQSSRIAEAESPPPA
jgi:flagellar protein FliO/FliZ